METLLLFQMCVSGWTKKKNMIVKKIFIFTHVFLINCQISSLMLKKPVIQKLKKKQKGNTDFLDCAKNFEFMKTLNSTDSLSVTKFKAIKKSKTEMVIPRPRNRFIIYRGLVQAQVSSEKDVRNLHDISKVTSKVSKLHILMLNADTNNIQMYQQRSTNVNKYLEYIAKQDENFSNSVYNAINERNRMSKETIDDIVSKIKIPKQGCKLKIKEYQKHLKLKPVVIKNGSNVEDIFSKEIKKRKPKKAKKI